MKIQKETSMVPSLPHMDALLGAGGARMTETNWMDKDWLSGAQSVGVTQ